MYTHMCVVCPIPTSLYRADLDPIYYCELLRACPVNDNGDAKITSVTVTPKEGPQGEWRVLVWCEKSEGVSGKCPCGAGVKV